ncbi:MAG: hypothetical protein AAGJ18_13450 [Bacteroidota bacterium]
MILGNFDFWVFAILILANVYFYKKRVSGKIGCFAIGLLFGLILPIISQKLEINNVSQEREILDNFTLLYTFCKFPIYWIIGGLQAIIFSRKQTTDA